MGTFSFTLLTHTHSQSMASCSHSSHYKVIQSFINGLCSCVDMETVLMINLKGKCPLYTGGSLGSKRTTVLFSVWGATSERSLSFSFVSVWDAHHIVSRSQRRMQTHFFLATYHEAQRASEFMHGWSQSNIYLLINWSQTISSIHKNCQMINRYKCFIKT